MIFTLEALQADFGDSLLLHYGSEESPKIILIDGGPDGVYQNSLRPRLEELREQNAGNPIVLEIVMVSHIDRDHITGILALTNELLKKKQAKQELPYNIVKLWHNSFDDFIKTKVEVLSAALNSAIKAADTETEIPINLSIDPSKVSVVADVKQGRTLRDNAKKLSLQLNKPFKGVVIAPPIGKKEVDIGNGLKFTIIAPNLERVEALQKEWDDTITKLGLAKDAQASEAIAAAYLDKSVPNLSSIVVMAEVNGKRMLLTGDARGDDILSGLKTTGLLTNGKLHVDLLKLPHHGSDRNVSTDFFRVVTADHYVVSANGKHTNPDIPTLKMISDARGQDKFTIYLTNKEKRLEVFFAEEKTKGKKYKVVFRKSNALSVQVKLGS
jgi:beta-lactamase superfamily II metal-dependent hydrolase